MRRLLARACNGEGVPTRQNGSSRVLPDEDLPLRPLRITAATMTRLMKRRQAVLVRRLTRTPPTRTHSTGSSRMIRQARKQTAFQPQAPRPCVHDPCALPPRRHAPVASMLGWLVHKRKSRLCTWPWRTRHFPQGVLFNGRPGDFRRCCNVTRVDGTRCPPGHVDGES